MLLQQGVRLNRKTVARIMRESSIRSKMAKRFKARTTDSDHAHPVVANVLDRRFTAQRPDTTWLCDITFIPTGEGWLYMEGVMDLCSRRIVGWSKAGYLRAELISDALTMATRHEHRGTAWSTTPTAVCSTAAARTARRWNLGT